MKNKAFTLIELLVVIAVLGLLSSIVLVSLRGQGQRAEYANLLQYDAQIKHALGAYILGEWTFNNGDLNDTSGNNANGIPGGPDIINFPSNDISELEFSSSISNNTYIEVSGFNLNNLKGYTVSAWVNTSDTQFVITYALDVMSGAENVFFYEDDYISGLVDNLNSTVGCDIGINFFQAGEWHHVVYTWKGLAAAIYIDGELMCSDSVNPGEEIDMIVPILAIGGFDGGYSIDGEMDNVRIYGEGLDIAEVQKIYAQEKVEHINK